MSLVTLKRNAKRFQVPISGGPTPFSLNGGYRNLRAVGNTNLAQIKTNSSLCSGNNPSIIKLSSKNTLGHIYESFKYPTTCITGQCPTIWVKNYSPEDHSQSIYIKELTQAVASQSQFSTACPDIPTIKTDAGKCKCPMKVAYRIGGRVILQNNYTKTPKTIMSSSDYIRTELIKQNCLPLPPNRQHWPPAVLHDGCDVNALTPAEAQALGLLPQDWMA
jgi:hypothetical protein